MSRQETVEVLQQAIHDNAREKGFWDSSEKASRIRIDEFRGEVETAFVTQKIALILTEVAEFDEEFFEAALTTRRSRSNNKVLEEVADVVIRTLDLFQHLDYVSNTYGTQNTGPYGLMYRQSPEEVVSDALLRVYKNLGKAVESLRRGEMAEYHLDVVVKDLFQLTNTIYAPGELEKAVASKVEKNLGRAKMHGGRKF